MISKRTLLALGAALSLGIAGIAVSQTASQDVYVGTVAQGWKNQGWGGSTDMSKNPSTKKPLTMYGGAWTGTAFRKTGFSTAGYTKLTFDINIGSNPTLTVKIKPVIDGVVQDNPGYSVKLTANTQTAVVAPLSDMAIDNKTIDGFNIQVMSNAEYETITIDNIKFQ